MKTKVVLFIAAALVSGVTAASAPGQAKTEKFKVHGNCGMCEKRVELAANAVDGVSAADWDKKSMVMTVTYDQSKTDVHKVQSAIAKAGHDTEMHRASDETYSKLHSCCKYKRAEIKTESSGSQNEMPLGPQGTKTASCCGGSNS